MKLQTICLLPITTNNNSLKHKNNKTIFNSPLNNNIGAFPSYYCPNINFGSKFGDIDFDYEFYGCAKNILKNHLDKMELTKNLSLSEKKDFQKKIIYGGDEANMLQFFSNKKPSVLLVDDFPYFQNNDKYNFVTRTIKTKLRNNKFHENYNTFIINKELTKQTINDNKELYTKRMGLNDSASVDEIYEELVGENSPLKKLDGYDDIIGITLGFSPINSILFQLERNIPDYSTLRKRPYVQSQVLKRELYSEDSVYKNFSNQFLFKVEDAIDSIEQPMSRPINLSQIGYTYIQFVPDEKHTQMIIKNAEEILENN